MGLLLRQKPFAIIDSSPGGSNHKIHTTMPPYNDIDTNFDGSIDPIYGDAISSNYRNNKDWPGPQTGGQQQMQPSASYASRVRPKFGAFNADVPSASSSSSLLFPRSHPRNNGHHQQQPTSASSVVSGSVHPHIQELVERQQQ